MMENLNYLYSRKEAIMKIIEEVGEPENIDEMRDLDELSAKLRDVEFEIKILKTIYNV